MVDFNKIAICDVLKHPKYGLVAYTPSMRDLIQNNIRVRDLNGVERNIKASECEEANEEESAKFWKEDKSNWS